MNTIVFPRREQPTRRPPRPTDPYQCGRKARRDAVDYMRNPMQGRWKRGRWALGWLAEDAAIEADPRLVP